MEIWDFIFSNFILSIMNSNLKLYSIVQVKNYNLVFQDITPLSNFTLPMQLSMQKRESVESGSLVASF